MIYSTIWTLKCSAGTLRTRSRTSLWIPCHLPFPVCLTQGISLCSIRKLLYRRLLKLIVPRDRHSTASLRPLTKHLRKLSQMQRLRSPKLMTMPQTQLLIKRKFQIKQVLNRSLR